MKDWTKLQQEALGSDGMSTLDLPWLGAMRAEDDRLQLVLKYLGGDSRSRVWEDSATKAFVEFQQNPFRITQLSVPKAFTESAGGPQQAFHELMHAFLADSAIDVVKLAPWEEIVNSVAKTVSDAQHLEIEPPPARKVALG